MLFRGKLKTIVFIRILDMFILAYLYVFCNEKASKESILFTNGVSVIIINIYKDITCVSGIACDPGSRFEWGPVQIPVNFL